MACWNRPTRVRLTALSSSASRPPDLIQGRRKAQTGGDTSLLLDAGVAGKSSASVECVLQVHILLDQPARVRASQYVMSGWVSTSAGKFSGVRCSARLS
jgi:hypothetical protein